MYWLITKYLITATLVVVISEVAKRSDKLGALIGSLPWVTILTLMWLYFERQPAEKITNHAYYTFFYVIPTLPMFVIFPYLFKHLDFWLTLLICAAITIVCFVLFAKWARVLGVNLL